MTKETLNIQVALRIRPLTDSDQAQPRFAHLANENVLKTQDRTVQVISQHKQFTFDYVFGTESAQSDVFDQVGDPLIRKFLTGRNTTFLTYGQTSSGKTYTMGTSSINQNGIVPSAMTLLFSLLPKEANLTVAFIEIYNEEVYDLLNQNSTITIREDGKGHTHWTGVQRLPVHDLHHVLHYLDQGLNNRATNATDMNEVSSRSHAIFSVILNHQDKQTKLHFVDLAGSERVRWMKRTTAEVDRRKEGIYINGGLLALGNVISSLASDKLHIPYRDSKLTRLLQDSLGGSALTLMIACVSPVGQHLQETVNTLQYASRARSIKNRAEPQIEKPSSSQEREDAAVLANLKTQLKSQQLKLDQVQARLHTSLGETQRREAYIRELESRLRGSEPVLPNKPPGQTEVQTKQLVLLEKQMEAKQEAFEALHQALYRSQSEHTQSLKELSLTQASLVQVEQEMDKLKQSRLSDTSPEEIDLTSRSSSSTQGEAGDVSEKFFIDGELFLHKTRLLEQVLKQRNKEEIQDLEGPEKRVYEMLEELSEIKSRMNDSGMSFYSCRDQSSEPLLLVKKGSLDKACQTQEVWPVVPTPESVTLRSKYTQLENKYLEIKQENIALSSEIKDYQGILGDIQESARTLSDEACLDYVKKLMTSLDRIQDSTGNNSLPFTEAVSLQLIEEYKARLSRAESLNSKLESRLLAKKKKRYIFC